MVTWFRMHVLMTKFTTLAMHRIYLWVSLQIACLLTRNDIYNFGFRKFLVLVSRIMLCVNIIIPFLLHSFKLPTSCTKHQFSGMTALDIWWNIKNSTISAYLYIVFERRSFFVEIFVETNIIQFSRCCCHVKLEWKMHHQILNSYFVCIQWRCFVQW